MRRDELVDGAWYLLKHHRRYSENFILQLAQYIDKRFYVMPSLKWLVGEVDEWARVNPEEFFDDTLRTKYE